jgi:hypothetical protein
MNLNYAGEKFAEMSQRRFYANSLVSQITNNDYQGQLSRGGADRVNIKRWAKIIIRDYSSGTDMTVQNIDDIEDQLIANQKKYWDFSVDDIMLHEDYTGKDVVPASIESAGKEMADTVDTYVLGMYSYVKAGHQIGSDMVVYGYGETVWCSVTSAGSVTASFYTDGSAGHGVGFQSSMVGLGFKLEAAGTGAIGDLVGSVSAISGDTESHGWYRISGVTDTSHCSITRWDGKSFGYDGNYGGAGYSIRIAAGRAARIAGSGNIIEMISYAKEALDSDRIPQDDRYGVVNSKVGALIGRTTEFATVAVPAAYENVIVRGLIGTVYGFKIYQSENITGDNTNGYYCLFGHKAYITFATALQESKIAEPEKQFGKTYAGLQVYGAKVTRERRKAGAYLLVRVPSSTI